VLAPPSTNPVPTPVNPDLRGKYRTAALSAFQESNSPLDLFDWKFEKYLTPWILRFTWIAALVIVSLMLLFSMASFVLSYMPDLQQAEVAAVAPARIPGPPPEANVGSRFAVKFLAMAGRIILLVVSFVGTIIGLLMFRVTLESVFILFHIAKSLASIDIKTGPAEPAT
jgi:ABC-type multidrug transport system fused ATPase/permease subunit